VLHDVSLNLRPGTIHGLVGANGAGKTTLINCLYGLENDFAGIIRDTAGPAVRERVRFVRDENVARIVANWPRGSTAARANKLGLKPDRDFADIVRQYIADCRASPGSEAALQGLSMDRQK